MLTFVVRFLSALCLFAFLARANLFLDVWSNTVLVLGYRALLVLSPLLTRWGRSGAGGLCFATAAGGTALWLVPSSPVRLAAALLVGFGLSVGGYVLKAGAAESAKGASYNKIALNCGSLLAGVYVALMAPSWGLVAFLVPPVVLLALCGPLSLRALRGAASTGGRRTGSPPAVRRHQVGWTLFGVAIGIKLFAVFAILPQYLLSRGGALPSWYGWLVSLNAVVIIVCQRPVMGWITRRGTEAGRSRAVLSALGCCMAVLAFPGWFHVEALAGAVVWILLCTLAECAASYLDVAASRAGCLFPKEAAAGLGAGLCVALSRFAGTLGPELIGALGLVCLLGGALCLRATPPNTEAAPAAA
ncbi:hypothetical protein [Streptomyces sp. NBC_00083]|uniref:hypothetical protein n=1 Tax=Streptomyces sp. NBC_00083 TaxID=2975647 RepID=UPI00225829B5|nr:hypothetical protein [Streptomyces sp. NBC_00083]MCX5388142.1 hypothetical protein [Streptomyces sp. NBC_00083]